MNQAMTIPASRRIPRFIPTSSNCDRNRHRLIHPKKCGLRRVRVAAHIFSDESSDDDSGISANPTLYPDIQQLRSESSSLDSSEKMWAATRTCGSPHFFG